MPGFFVDRKSYENDRSPLEGVGPITHHEKGVYDLFHQLSVNVSDPLCCPEKDCCEPLYVVATLDGFPGGTRINPNAPGPYNVISYDGFNDPCSAILDEYNRRFYYICTDTSDPCLGIIPYGHSRGQARIFQSSYYGWAGGSPLYFPGVAHCNLMYENNIPIGTADLYSSSEYGNKNALTFQSAKVGHFPDSLVGTSGSMYDCMYSYYGDMCTELASLEEDHSPKLLGLYNYNTMWPDSIFPSTGGPILCTGIQYISEPNSCGPDGARAYAVGGYEWQPYSSITRPDPDDGYIHDFTTVANPGGYYTWGQLCYDDATSFICSKPNGSPYHVGPVANVCTYENDLNDAQYVCRKVRSGNKPELKPTITRSIPLSGTDLEDIEADAILLYEVAPRRKWMMERVSWDCRGAQISDGIIRYCPDEEDPVIIDGDGMAIEKFNGTYYYPTGIPVGEFVPKGNFYCIDYRCGKRYYPEMGYTDWDVDRNCINEVPPDEHWRQCYNFQCTGGMFLPGYERGNDSSYPYDIPDIPGAARPHLAVHGDGTNFSAELTPILKPIYPDVWESDHGRFPYSWEVADLEVVEPGSGYSVGDFFTVQFDSNWINAYDFIHGQYVFPFPTENPCKAECPFLDDLEWADSYGFNQETNTITPGYPIQRFRIAATGLLGSVRRLERLPWYKNPEYDPDASCIEICLDENSYKLSGNEKTKYYPRYTRILCHPVSVAAPGKGYNIGDTITWNCFHGNGSGNCTIWRDNAATATVVDVDENGGILDWYISGSDAPNLWGWCTGGICPCEYSVANTGLFRSYGCAYPNEQDDRGCYNFYSEDLCDLSWHAYGGLVRARGRTLSENTMSTDTNASEITQVYFHIDRIDSQTSFEVLIASYDYDKDVLSEDGTNMPSLTGTSTEDFLRYYKYHFPPYPECVGGGSIISPVFGPSGSNDSMFGGSLISGIVQAPGAYYAYVGKKHVEPILPSAVPSDLDGTGAYISYTFDHISQFPHPALFDGCGGSISQSDYRSNVLDNDRFAYFPITSVNIDVAGSGYQVGEIFVIKPSKGEVYSDPWSKRGGDDPERNPNGGWYNFPIDADNGGYMPFSTCYPYVYLSDTDTSEGPARFKITSVNGNGGITGLKILSSGLMYRPVWLDGIVHPDVYGNIESTLGYGATAYSGVVIDSDKDSDTFGKVLDFVISTDTSIIDPLHGYDPYPVEIYPPVYVGDVLDAGTKIGHGRDYADPSYGYFWILNDIQSIGTVDAQCSLLAYYNRGHRAAYPTTERRPLSNDYLFDQHADPVELNILHPENSTHEVVTGGRISYSAPPFIPISNVCAFSECYHSLLNKTYTLYRKYSMFGPTEDEFGYMGWSDYDFPPAGNFPQWHSDDINYCLIVPVGKSITYWMWDTSWTNAFAIDPNYPNAISDTSDCEAILDTGCSGDYGYGFNSISYSGPDPMPYRCQCWDESLNNTWSDQNINAYDDEFPAVIYDPNWAQPTMIEWGMTITLSGVQPENCPDHKIGRTETYFDKKVVNVRYDELSKFNYKGCEF